MTDGRAAEGVLIPGRDAGRVPLMLCLDAGTRGTANRMVEGATRTLRAVGVAPHQAWRYSFGAARSRRTTSFHLSGEDLSLSPMPLLGGAGVLGCPFNTGKRATPPSGAVLGQPSIASDGRPRSSTLDCLCAPTSEELTLQPPVRRPHRPRRGRTGHRRDWADRDPPQKATIADPLSLIHI